MSKRTTKVREDVITALQMADSPLDCSEIAGITGHPKNKITDTIWRLHSTNYLKRNQVRRLVEGRNILVYTYTINLDGGGQITQPVPTKPSKLIASLPPTLQITLRMENGELLALSVNDARYLHRQLGQLFAEK
jgi:hypothetical protein